MADIQKRQRAFARCEADVLNAVQKPSKYRNVRIEIGGAKFDSKLEAEHWMFLKTCEANGSIRELRRQVRFPLYAPLRVGLGPSMDTTAKIQVAEYVADFVYWIDREQRVVDVKSKATRTQTYRLKRKWLELQDGIQILEV